MSEWKETEMGLIPKEWHYVSFQSVLSQSLRNGIYKSKEYHGRGIRVVNMGEIFAFDKLPSIQMSRIELSDEEIEKSSVIEGDLLFARRSLVAEGAGKCTLVLKQEENLTFESSIIRARPNSKKANSEYLLYLFSCRIGKYLLKTILRQVAVSGITGSDLAKLKLPLPPIEEQKRIAAVLSCLDAKIDNLRRQNETLEKIAQTLFKHWFIDFEFPNEEGKPYKSSGGAMSPSELGDIPAGWKVGKLGDVAKNIRLNIKENDILSNTPYIGLEHIPRKTIVLDTWSNSEDLSSNKFIFQKGQILFGKLRPYFHKVGVAFISGICSTDILVIDAIKQEYFGCLLMLISNDNFIKYVSSASEGTRMPRTNWEYMKNYLFPLSNQLKIYKDFTNFINSFLVKIDNNTKQIQTLTKTRDALLPKLMSGEIRIKE